MVKVIWTQLAVSDLNDIGDYISKDSEKYAKILIQNLFVSAELLESYPKAGRIVPELKNKKIRELIRGNYRIVYRLVDNNRVDILTVHHAARLLTRSSLLKRKK